VGENKLQQLVSISLSSLRREASPERETLIWKIFLLKEEKFEQWRYNEIDILASLQPRTSLVRN